MNKHNMERKSDKNIQEAPETSVRTAVIRDTFHVQRRGLVLVLDEIDGATTGAGIIKSARGSSRFSGPEIIDFTDKSHALAVIALESNAKDNFVKGDKISLELPGGKRGCHCLAQTN